LSRDGKNSGRVLVRFGTICLNLCDRGDRVANTDRRIRRTCKSLHEALISLLLEKNYDEITVQEILDRTDVGRSTFYAHFEGKDELLVSGIHDLRITLDFAV